MAGAYGSQCFKNLNTASMLVWGGSVIASPFFKQQAETEKGLCDVARATSMGRPKYHRSQVGHADTNTGVCQHFKHFPVIKIQKLFAFILL